MSDAWLPDLLLFKDSNGDWKVYLEKLHQQFLQDFEYSKPTWPSKRVGLKRHPEYDGKSATFWHMISEGESEQDRTPDFRRCERIAWPRPIMDEFDHSSPGATTCRIHWWCETRRGEVRYMLALDDFSYLVVVADRGEFVLPWTAFTLQYEHEKRKKRKAWQTYWDEQKS